MSDTLPTVVTAAGLQPQAPATLNAELLALVASWVPGYTATLPGSLIEDVSSTDTGALVLIDQARVETVDSLTPYGANDWLLIQLGNMLGVPAQQASNTSVYVVFTISPAVGGYSVAQGFTVSDGTYQYVLVDGGVTAASGSTQPLQAIASQTGSWAVPPSTVTQLVTSVPSTVTLTVTNPLAGTPGGAAQTEAQYRTAVLQANLAASQGMTRYLKTLIGNIPGVQQRLVSIQAGTGTLKCIVGGSGDPYLIGGAIWQADFWTPGLIGSTISVTNITRANPGVVTTDINHGYANGQVVYINGIVGMTSLNGVALTITVINETSFSVGVNTSGYSAWISGGVVTPNFRNVVVTIVDYPDSYDIPFVAPPAQAVTITVTWNTISTNPVSDAGVAQLASPALAAYVNSIYVGQPMNLFQLQEVFTASIATILPPAMLTRMVFSVNINGIGTSPLSGTGVIAGDPESYFSTDPGGAGITVLQG